MARTGLPKKYAKMGFKRGWKAYKASKRRTTSTRRRTPVKRTYRRKRPMARRRSYRRTARRAYTARGGMKPILDGVIGGIAAEAGQKFIGGYGGAIGTLGAGYFM